MHRIASRLIALLAATPLLLTLPADADTPASGFSLANQPNPAFGAAQTTLSGGEQVVWDGLDVVLFAADGTLLDTLTSFASPVFPSFVVAAPDETLVVIGNSSNGRLHVVQVDGSGRSFLARLDFNFDAAFEGQDSLLVSAAACGFGCGNQVLRVELATGARERVAQVAGASGPLALDAAGNLYYGTVSDLFPAPPAASDVLRWTAAQVRAGSVLDESDATLFASGFEALGSLAFDPVDGDLFAASNDFSLGVYRVLRVEATGASSALVVDAANAVSGLQFLAGGGQASFDAYQPSDGSHLRYTTTDFFSLSDVVTVRPLRPQLVVTGPGTVGPGPFTLEVTGAEPHAAASLVFGSQASMSPVEELHRFPCFRLFSRLDFPNVRRVEFAFATDSNGNAQVTFFNTGNLAGAHGYQFLVRDSAGKPIGSSNDVTF